MAELDLGNFYYNAQLTYNILPLIFALFSCCLFAKKNSKIAEPKYIAFILIKQIDIINILEVSLMENVHKSTG